MANRRDALAHWLQKCGVVSAIEHLPSPGQLIVVNYHRIGSRDETLFDPEVITTSAEALDAQISALRKYYAIVDEAEALDLVSRAHAGRGKAILLTFDDGYLDNLQLAVPVLRANGVKALFFLVTSFLDDPWQIPWWDRIAWLVRLCKGRTLTLSRPDTFDTGVIGDANVTATIREVLRRYREAPAADAAILLAELEACAGIAPGQRPDTRERLLMNWEEAGELRDHGMDIGLHTHTHPILAKLPAAAQRHELATCRQLIQERLGIKPRSLAYPVGSPAAFGPDTMRIAREIGCEAAFSFYGGSNIAGRMERFDVRRVEFTEDASPTRARAAVALLSATQSVWL